MPFQLTLRFRIITLVSIFTIVLITAFNAVLVTQQLQVINENNEYRARVGTFSAKNAFERTLLSTTRTGRNPHEAFQRLIPVLQEGKLAEEVMVADLRGRVVAATNSYLMGTSLSPEEVRNSEKAQRMYTAKNWFLPQVEPNRITLYTPITLDDEPEYVAVFRYSLGNMGNAIQQATKLCLLTALGVTIVVVPLCLMLIHSILGPIRTLNEATKDVSAGNVGLQVSVSTEDELGELADTFNDMTAALLRMKQRAENANPLTRLPGNNMIHEDIEKRIKGKKKFVAVYSDLDNFKAFNDKYGIGEGDKAILLTADVMREAVKKAGPSTFLGHEGGDDFIVVTIPEKVDELTRYICTEFDKRIKELYLPEDRSQGYIVSKDREGNVKQFPLMTISIAGVTNLRRELDSYAEVTNICADVKKKAKLTSKNSGKSSFVLDQRHGNGRGEAPPKRA